MATATFVPHVASNTRDLIQRCAGCRLRDCNHFLELAASEQAVIEEASGGRVALPAHTELTRYGSGPMVLTLREGWAYSYLTLPGGKRQIVDFLVPGDVVGLDAVMFGRSNVAARTLTASVVCRFESRTILGLIGQSPAIATALMQTALAGVRAMEHRVATLGRKSAVERVASLLLDFYQRSAALDQQTNHSVFFPITQRLLADASGLTATHVNTSLKHLRGDGVIELSGRLLTICDLPRLKSIARATQAGPDRKLLL